MEDQSKEHLALATEPPSPLMSIDEARRYLRCARKEVEKLINLGKLKYIQRGRTRYLLRGEVEGVIEKEAQCTTPKKMKSLLSSQEKANSPFKKWL